MSTAQANARAVEFGEVDVSFDDPFSEIKKVTESWGPNSTLLLFDARHAAYRAIHTRTGLTAPNGENTCGLHGFLEIVSQVCDIFRTTKFLCVWDGGVEAKRAIHPLYKSRQDKPSTVEGVTKQEEIRAAMRVTKDGAKKIELPSVYFKEFEADDLIGFLSKMRKPREIARTVIVSDDKDFYQLISDDCFIWRGITKRLVTPGAFRNEFPFEPEAYVDYKALVGEPETGDNIPGVAGFGEKTAAKYVGSHGSLEDAIAFAQKAVKGSKPQKVDVNLANSVDEARLSYRLSRIARDISDLAQWSNLPVAEMVSRRFANVLEVGLNAHPKELRRATRILRGEYGFAHETCASILPPMGYS